MQACASTCSASTRHRDGSCASSARFPTACCSSPGPPAAARPRRCTRRSPRPRPARDKIVTIEDPVEYQLPGRAADPGQREEGPDLRARPALHPAPRPGQDHGGRDPRPGDRPDRHPVGAHRPPGVHHRARQQRVRRHRPLRAHGRRHLQLRLGAERASSRSAWCASSASSAPSRTLPSRQLLEESGSRIAGHASLPLPHRARAASTAAAPATAAARRSANCWCSTTRSARPSSAARRCASSRSSRTQAGVRLLRDVGARAGAVAAQTTLEEVNRVTIMA